MHSESQSLQRELRYQKLIQVSSSFVTMTTEVNWSCVLLSIAVHLHVCIIPFYLAFFVVVITALDIFEQ